MLNSLHQSAPTFSELLRFVQRLPTNITATSPQAKDSSKKGFTMLLPGDEEYETGENDSKSIPGGRNRLRITYDEKLRPRSMTMEHNLVGSKL
jgi:hypothetical protein